MLSNSTGLAFEVLKVCSILKYSKMGLLPVMLIVYCVALLSVFALCSFAKCIDLTMKVRSSNNKKTVVVWPLSRQG